MANLNVKGSIVPKEGSVQTRDPETLKSARNKLDAFIKEDTVMVKGRFRCFDNPGSSVRIQIKKYKDVPMFDKTMIDEGTYEIPLYVARHLNGIDATATHLNGKIHSCSYPVHGFKTDGMHLPESYEGLGPDGPTLFPKEHIAKRVRRYGFESLEFSVE